VAAARRPAGLAFCSELAPLLALVDPRSIAIEPLAELFAYGWYLGSEVWVEGVHALLDSDLIIEGDRSFERPRATRSLPPPSSIGLRDAVRSSVRRCVAGTGPFGLALSGGLDSTILAFELDALGVEDLVTVSIRLPDSADGVDSLDALGLPPGGAWTTWRHHVVEVPDCDLFATFERATRAFGQPTTMSSLPLTWRLAEVAAAAGVRVMLTGEGVDELFLGYGSYSKVPGLARLADYYHHPSREALVEGLFEAPVLRAVRARMDRICAHATDLREVERRLRLRRLLLRTDVCFMAHTMEVRVPFLHNRIPEIAMATPWSELLRDGGKATLRRAWCEQIGGRVGGGGRRHRGGAVGARDRRASVVATPRAQRQATPPDDRSRRLNNGRVTRGARAKASISLAIPRD